MANRGVVPINAEPPDSQAQVLAFLGDPAAYGPDVGEVARIETHISAIFLAGDRAYKMKRAVTLPFLDFSTLELRHQACQAELAVNRRTAPDLYLALMPVKRRSDGTLALGGPGETVEWLVVMRRFEQTGLFDHLARSGTLDASLVRELAERVARFHAIAERRPAFGGEKGLHHTIVTNARCFDDDIPGLFDAAKAHGLTSSSLEWLARLSPMLETRRRQGMVRQCHGDLHLGNVCLVDGVPTLFDAIEFNDDFAAIDTLYDFSFLLMDLAARASVDLANAAFNRYFEIADDIGGLAAMPLFLSLRAAIRAHVAARTARLHGDPAERAEALRYMDLAIAYLAPPPPVLIAVGGLSGSGKTTLARRLAPGLGAAPGALVLRSDVLRKRLMGAAPEERLPPSGYEASVTKATYDSLAANAEKSLRAGQAVILDAVFAKPEERDGAEQLASRLGVPFIGLWLDADATVMRARVAQRTHDASDATVEILNRQLAFPLGGITWARINAGANPEQTFETARNVLSARTDLSGRIR